MTTLDSHPSPREQSTVDLAVVAEVTHGVMERLLADLAVAYDAARPGAFPTLQRDLRHTAERHLDAVARRLPERFARALDEARAEVDLSLRRAAAELRIRRNRDLRTVAEYDPLHATS